MVTLNWWCCSNFPLQFTGWNLDFAYSHYCKSQIYILWWFYSFKCFPYLKKLFRKKFHFSWTKNTQNNANHQHNSFWETVIPSKNISLLNSRDLLRTLVSIYAFISSLTHSKWFHFHKRNKKKYILHQQTFVFDSLN